MRGRKRWVMLLAVPVLLAGCSAVPGWPTAAPSGSAAVERSGDSWVLVRRGTPTPSVSTQVRPSPTPSRTGFLPLGTPAPRPTPTPTCTDISWRIGRINGLEVEPGPGTATVRWVNAGGADLVAYRVTAISQRLVRGKQRDVGWQTLVPTRACAAMSATIAGLDRATPYTFSLDAVFRNKNSDGTHASTVARTLVVWTT